MMILIIMMKVQESVKMCLNLLERPVSALHCKIFNIYKTIDTSVNLLTGLLSFADAIFRWWSCGGVLFKSKASQSLGSG